VDVLALRDRWYRPENKAGEGWKQSKTYTYLLNRKKKLKK
jgi:hypothetical protein